MFSKLAFTSVFAALALAAPLQQRQTSSCKPNFEWQDLKITSDAQSSSGAYPTLSLPKGVPETGNLVFFVTDNFWTPFRLEDTAGGYAWRVAGTNGNPNRDITYSDDLKFHVADTSETADIFALNCSYCQDPSSNPIDKKLVASGCSIQDTRTGQYLTQASDGTLATTADLPVDRYHLFDFNYV